MYPMKKHSSEHQDESNKAPPTCGLCDKPFPTETMLRNHIDQFDTLKECPDCGFVYTLCYQLKKHRMWVHESIEGVLACECSRTFVELCDLKNHLQSHADEKLHSCELCGAKFKSEKHVMQHEQSIHENKKKHKCQICDCAFDRLGSRTHHEELHSYGRKYSCKSCGRQFSRLDSKNRHEQKHLSLGGPGFKYIPWTQKNINQKEMNENFNQNMF
ncbi:hypothetical protein QAD02_007109 [Eretmocerus hayati]|uniref:Uncharacterized protein n=1 Tax=Eretmocerus hayati TaxID=131215 RepID=A0ACC2N2S4_9HYME|nr:hypothetical protein QAD02_007109 [Eretmocerus hayati]